MISAEQIGSSVDLRPLVRQERAALLEVLADLGAADWEAPTACPGWSVHGVVSHLLHDDLRRISRTRDRWAGGPRPEPEQGLAAFLDEWNDTWVHHSRFISPRLLIDLLTATAPLIADMWDRADLGALGEGVAWAGIDPAPGWLDLAREYTEAWTHQQQVRSAVGRPGFDTGRALEAALDTFVRALPYTYRLVPAATGTVVAVETTGAVSRRWTIERGAAGWRLCAAPMPAPAASVTIPADLLWRMATGAEGAREESTRRATLRGDLHLAYPALDLVSVIR